MSPEQRRPSFSKEARCHHKLKENIYMFTGINVNSQGSKFPWPSNA